LDKGTLALGTPLLPHGAGDLPLLLVVEREPEGIAKGHQGPFHRIGFCLLEGGFMGKAQIHVDAMAGAAALAYQGGGPTGLAAQTDADPGDVGDPPAGLLVPADGALAFRDAAQLDRFPLPAIKAKDAVCLLNGYPSLQVIEGAPGLAAGLDVCPVEGSGQGGGLLRGEQP